MSSGRIAHVGHGLAVAFVKGEGEESGGMLVSQSVASDMSPDVRIASMPEVANKLCCRCAIDAKAPFMV